MPREDEVLLVTADDRVPGAPTPGMAREQAVATDGMWAGLVLTEPGMTSGWHHHGDYETSIYMLSGEMRLEFGSGGARSVDARAGDFLYIPKGLVHRESNPSDGKSTGIVIRAGGGEPVFNVEAP